MSWNPAIEPGCPDEVRIDAIETLIIPRSRDLGGFVVRRALPAPKSIAPILSPVPDRFGWRAVVRPIPFRGRNAPKAVMANGGWR